MELLPQYEGLEVVQKTYRAFGNEYHRYQVLKNGENLVTCENCADCRKGKTCKGLPSVTSVSGQYGGGGLYPAGYRHALDAVFGEYTDRAKDAVKDGGWMSDYARSTGLMTPMVPMVEINYLDDLLRYRQEVEEIPTPGKVSSEFGVGVHAALESVLTGEGEVPVKYADAVDAVMGWLNKGGPDGPYVVEDVEVNVFHPELLYAGQIDCVARCGNRVIIIDWKSGRGIYDSHAMQVAAYAMAYEAMTGEAVAEAWVVQSGRHGFAAKQVRDLIPAQKAFIAIQEAKRNVRFIDWDEE